LRHSDGREEILDPKVMQVFVALLKADRRLLTRADLNFSCWDRVVGDDSLNRVLSRLRKTAAGIGNGVFSIETVKRIGFRLVRTEKSSGSGRWIGDRLRAGRLPPVLRQATAFLLVLLAVAAGFAVLQRRGVAPPVPTASIAVLPFRTLTPGDELFAEGVSEEILAQLARGSDLHVMGRSSSWLFRDSNLDARAVGRRLRVANVLEGSVRRSGEHVRVNASLVSTSTGAQIWAQGFEGQLDDVIAIQTRIGSAVAQSLNRELASASGRKRTDGTAHSLYLIARGLIRTREPANTSAAIGLLQQAHRLEPNSARVVASLATAIQLRWFYWQRSPADGLTHPQALALARKAQLLDPSLAEAHAALAMIQGFQGREARRAIETAVRLDPNSAENWFWLSLHRETRGEYQGSLEAGRRAVALDPLWERAYRSSAETAWALGLRSEAEGYLRRAERDGADPHFVRSIRARLIGDWSTAALETRLALARAPADGTAQTAVPLARIFWILGRADEGARLDRGLVRWRDLARGALPTRAAFLANYPSDIADWHLDDHAFLLERLLLKHGRGADLVAAYDRYIVAPGRLERMATSHQAFIEEAPSMALALQQAGRAPEARTLLAMADSAARQRLARGPVPHWYYADCARLWSVAGDEKRAVAALRQAVARGWTYPDFAAFRDIANEPAFAPLKSNAEFRAIAASMRAQLQREQREAAGVSWP
jgi:TolB-like protein/tetratricopeptide (TPR) repeat protein